MRVLIATVWLLAGCDKLFTLNHVGDPADALVPDVDVDADPCPFGVVGMYGPGGTGLFRACLATALADTLETPAVIDTSRTTDCTFKTTQPAAGSENVCVIAAKNVLVASTTRAIGNIPLVLVATNAIVVSNALDASSIRTGGNGSGFNYSGCATGLSGDDGSASVGAGGGAGGTYQAAGGAGGAGENGISAGGLPAPPTTSLTFVRGGCRGGQGGLGGTAAGSGGGGGASGGAVYLIAGTSITLNGSALINASAEAGAGGAKGGATGIRGGAGGGGGSGGLIGLDAPMVIIASGARLLANGAGGGGSGGYENGGNGLNGKSSATTVPYGADGGASVTPGGNGADASRSSGVGGSGPLMQSGGGGGGGPGYIEIFTTNMVIDGAATFSPPHN